MTDHKIPDLSLPPMTADENRIYRREMRERVARRVDTYGHVEAFFVESAHEMALTVAMMEATDADDLPGLVGRPRTAKAPQTAQPAARTSTPEGGDGTIVLAAGALPARARPGSVAALTAKMEARAEDDDDKKKDDEDPEDDPEYVRCGSPGCGTLSLKASKYCRNCGASLAPEKARDADDEQARALRVMAEHFSGSAPRPGAPVMAATTTAQREAFAPIVLETPKARSTALERENEILSRSPHFNAPELRRR